MTRARSIKRRSRDRRIIFCKWLAFRPFGVIVNYNTTSLKRGFGGYAVEKPMSKRFIQLTSGWIPVAMLLLLAAALVSGEPRTDLAKAVTAAPTAPATDVEAVTLMLRSIVEMQSEVTGNLDAILLLSDGELDALRLRNERGAGQ
jgi:hypothetical protein